MPFTTELQYCEMEQHRHCKSAVPRKEERRFLDNVDISWDQQVAIMFQIVSVLVIDAPEPSACLDQSQGVPSNVLLPSEPWGHIDHNGSLSFVGSHGGLYPCTVCCFTAMGYVIAIAG